MAWNIPTTYSEVSWFTRPLAGVLACQRATWFRTHHENGSWEQAPGSFHWVGWQVAHAAARDRWASAHAVSLFVIRVVGPGQPDGDSPTFKVRADCTDTGHPWWEYPSRVEEKRQATEDFMQGAVNANYDDDLSVQPGLEFSQPGATAVIAGEACSLGCGDAIALGHSQAQYLEDRARLWEFKNIRREVGESIPQAATAFRGDPVQLIPEVEGRQINVLVNLPTREEESDPDAPRLS